MARWRTDVGVAMPGAREGRVRFYHCICGPGGVMATGARARGLGASGGPSGALWPKTHPKRGNGCATGRGTASGQPLSYPYFYYIIRRKEGRKERPAFCLRYGCYGCYGFYVPHGRVRIGWCSWCSQERQSVLQDHGGVLQERDGVLENVLENARTRHDRIGMPQKPKQP